MPGSVVNLAKTGAAMAAPAAPMATALLYTYCNSSPTSKIVRIIAATERYNTVDLWYLTPYYSAIATYAI